MWQLLHSKVIPLSLLSSCKEATVRVPHPRSRVSGFILTAECLHKLFEILLHKRSVYSPPFINLFISVWIHRSLVYTSGYNPTWFIYFAALIVLARPLGTPLVGSSCLL